MSDKTHQLSISIRIRLGDFKLDVDRSLAISGVTGLFGPSGSGKSTLLRIVAGLERKAEGCVTFGSDTWQDSKCSTFVPAHQRQVGYVFQDARLFSHLSVNGNLQYAIKRNEEVDRSIHFDEIVAAFDLSSLLARGVNALSGGERQRVAIARTLLTQPRLLLLDEPLAALDVGRKNEIMPYLEGLPERFGIPAIFVSHAVNEMARMADDVVVLESGRISAAGPASSILSREDLQLSALPFEAVTILNVRVVEHLKTLRLTTVTHHGQQMTVPEITNVQVGGEVRLSIRAGDVVLATEKPHGLSVRNVVAGTLTDITEIAGTAFSTASVDVNGSSIKAQLTRHAVAELDLVGGQSIYVLIKTASFNREL